MNLKIHLLTLSIFDRYDKQSWLQKYPERYICVLQLLLINLLIYDLSIIVILDSRAALSNSYANTCLPSREAVCTIFMMVFDMTQPGGGGTHDQRPTAWDADTFNH